MGFIFAFQSKLTCDIMINFPSVYRLSVAKLVVDEKKQPEWLFFRCQRHEARSIGSEYMSARDDYATAVSTPLCSHGIGSLKRSEMSQVRALFGEPEKRKDHEGMQN